MREMTGALYFYDDEIIGHLKIGDEHFQISGVRVSAIRADIKAMRTSDDKPGKEGGPECDLA